MYRQIAMENNDQPSPGAPTSTPTSTTPTRRMTVFPRGIVDTATTFSYPPKLGSHRHRSSSSSSRTTTSNTQQHVRASTHQTLQATSPASETIPQVAALTILGTPSAPTFSNLGMSSLIGTPRTPGPTQVPRSNPQFLGANFQGQTSSSHATPARFITRKFMVMPDAVHGCASGLPSITHWPFDPQHVMVSLEDSKRWAGVTFPLPFLADSVEFHMGMAFLNLLQCRSSGSNISGTFLKEQKKEKELDKIGLTS